MNDFRVVARGIHGKDGGFIVRRDWLYRENSNIFHPNAVNTPEKLTSP